MPCSAHCQDGLAKLAKLLKSAVHAGKLVQIYIEAVRLPM